MAHPSLGLGLRQSVRLALPCALGCLLGFGTPAGAAEIYAGDGLAVRWDNTLSYSMALRPMSPSPELLSYINGDDGDRNFGPGLVSNRFSLLS